MSRSGRVAIRAARDLWRPVLWIPSLFCIFAAVAASGAIARGCRKLRSSLHSALHVRVFTYNYDRSGPLGVVFVLMIWTTIFSLVMLGGSLIGYTIWRRGSAPDQDAVSPGCNSGTGRTETASSLWENGARVPSRRQSRLMDVVIRYE